MKTRKSISLLLSIVILMSFIPIPTIAATPKMAGSGKAGDPYIITDKSQLSSMTGSNVGTYFKLGCDININGWGPQIDRFEGELDGGGYSIKGMEVVMRCEYSSDTKFITDGEMFTWIADKGVVKNLVIESPKLYVQIRTKDATYALPANAALFANTNNGTINNVKINNVQATLTFKDNAGGYYDPNQKESYFWNPNNIGILTYKNTGKILNSYVSGEVNITTVKNVGVLAVENTGTIANVRTDVKICQTDRVYDALNNNGTVTEYRSEYVSGGVVYNKSDGVMWNVWCDTDFSSELGDAVATKDKNAILCCKNEGKIKDCYYAGNIQQNMAKSDTGIADGTAEGAENGATKKTFDQSIYDSNTESNPLNIQFLNKYGVMISPWKNIVIYIKLEYGSLGLREYKQTIVTDEDTIVLPYLSDIYYNYGELKLPDGTVKYPGDTISVSGDMAITATAVKRLEPVTEFYIVSIPVAATEFPTWNKWREYKGSIKDAPSQEEMTRSEAKLLIAKVRDDGTVTDEDFIENQPTNFSPGDKFCYRFVIPEKAESMLQYGKFDLFTAEKDSDTGVMTVTKPTCEVKKIDFVDEISRYVKLTLPENRVASEDPTMIAMPTIDKVNPAIWPSNMEFWVEKDRIKTSKIQYVGSYDVYVKSAGDDVFEAGKKGLASFDVSRRVPNITVQPITAKHNTDFQIQVDVKSIIDNTGIEKYIKNGTIKLYSFYVDGTSNTEYQRDAVVNKDKVVWDFDGLPAGTECKVSLRYVKDDSQGAIYDDAYKTGITFTVSKADGTVSLATDKSVYEYGDNVEITVDAPMVTNPATELTVSDTSNASADIEYKGVENGKYVYTYKNPKVGTLNLKAAYSGSEYYTSADDTASVTVNKFKLEYTVSNTEQHYTPNVERKITIRSNSEKLTDSDYTVKYYRVKENSGVLESTTPETKVITYGRYMYVITLTAAGKTKFELKKPEFAVADTTIPNFTQYGNVGYLDINPSSDQQEPIAFEEGDVEMKVGETYNNTLQSSGGTITYSSSNEDVATVGSDGTVTALKAGTATITAKSVKAGTTPVYASYKVTVRKELTVDDFTITVAEKTYDETKDAKITAVVKEDSLQDSADVVTVAIEGEFADANSGESKDVTFTITGLSGKNAGKYILADNVEGTVKGKINKADVTIICAETTTRTFDGEKQEVDVSAMSGGKVFNRTNYSVMYEKINTPEEAVATAVAPSENGEYKITIKLTDEAAKNYNVIQPTATLIIKKANQGVFSIDGVPDTVYYGDTFELSSSDATGNVSYRADGDVLTINGNRVVANKTGKVTITAVSTKAGYVEKTATKTIDVKKRVLTPTVEVLDRDYNGEISVAVNKVELANLLDADMTKVSATAKGSMANSDAGEDKVVYVSDFALSGENSEYYTLSTQSLQTTVTINPATITAFTIIPQNKKYDGNENATVTIGEINGVLRGDMGKVSVIGNGVFEDANSGTGKTVTYTATGLSGMRAHNYVLAESAKRVTATANIAPLRVDFVIGQMTFVYDKANKSLTAFASDENGKVFRDFTFEYKVKDSETDEPVTPNEAGEYTATVKLGDTTNYYTNQAEITLTIANATQDSIVIAGLPGTVSYGTPFELVAVGGVGGGKYEWTSSNSDVSISFADESDKSKAKVVVNGSVGETVEISVVKSADNYNNVKSKVVFIPVAKQVAFKLDNLNQTYGSVTPVSVTSNEEDAEYEITYNDSTTLPTNAGTYTVKVKATGANYTGEQTGTLVINKRNDATGEITGLNSEYTYGTGISGVSATSTMSGVRPTITYSGTGIYSPQAEAPKNVGKYTAIATFTDPNYETLTVTKDFEIKTKTLNVKAKRTERVYGEANPAVFELDYMGFEYGETKDVLLSEPIAVSSAKPSSPITDDTTMYYITVSGGRAENYSFEYDNTGELVILPSTTENLYITGASNTVYVKDQFRLHTFCGNSKVEATWRSSDDSIAEVSEDGSVIAKKAGTVTIMANAGPNYGGREAEFPLTVKKVNISLTPTNIIKTYTGDRQDISFAENSDFTPILSGEEKNIEITYTKFTDSTPVDPVDVGEYSVVYNIIDESYAGGGNTTLRITKANVTAKAADDDKIYGDVYTDYGIEITNDGGITNDDVLEELKNTIKAATTFKSDGAAKKAVVKDGGYEIEAKATGTETENVKFTVGNGTLTVVKAPLTVKVKDVTREYGEKNPKLEATITGFKNGESKKVLKGELVLAYENITEETAIGVYPDAATASGLEADNYEIIVDKGDVTITPIQIKASAGTAKETYLTVKLSKAIEGLTFEVMHGDEPVSITDITPSKDNRTYTLYGTFEKGENYTVNVEATDAVYEITNVPLTIKVSSSSSGAGGGGGTGGGGGGGGAAKPALFDVVFNSNGGSEVKTQKVEKNDTAVEPTAPTKDGFEFGGWFSDTKLTKEYDFASKVLKSLTLYAKWLKSDYVVDPSEDPADEPKKEPTPTEWKNPFSDVSEDYWYYDSVKFVNQNELMSGVTDDTFGPDVTLTRGMLVTVLYRAAGAPAVNKSIPFGDVSSDSYYRDAVIWAQQNGIVNGVSETEFAPEDKITREQIATIVYRYAEYCGIAPQGAWAIKLDYSDLAEISDYATEGVMYCTLKGIMQGKDNNCFAPRDNATRAEIAAILQRILSTASAK